MGRCADVVPGRLAEQILARERQPRLIERTAAERVRIPDGPALVVPGLQRQPRIGNVDHGVDRVVPRVLVVLLRIPREQPVRLGDLVVDTARVLIGVADDFGRADEIVPSRFIVLLTVGQRILPIAWTAAGSRRALGITLVASGVRTYPDPAGFALVVAGSYNRTGMKAPLDVRTKVWLKSPSRSSVVGTCDKTVVALV